MKRGNSWIALRGLGACAAVLLFCVAFAGCGGGKKQVSLAKVTGKVTQGGQPLVAAEVMFLPKAAGSPSGGKTDENGRFELRFSDGRPGAAPGKYGVVITASGPEAPAPTGGAQAPPPPKEPVEFRDEAEVQADKDNDFTFEVKKGPAHAR